MFHGGGLKMLCRMRYGRGVRLLFAGNWLELNKSAVTAATAVALGDAQNFVPAALGGREGLWFSIRKIFDAFIASSGVRREGWKCHGGFN
jgi:hypothetical protein